MVGTLISAIVDVFLNVAMGFISLFVAFVVAPTINALIVAAVFFSVVGSPISAAVFTTTSDHRQPFPVHQKRGCRASAREFVR